MKSLIRTDSDIKHIILYFRIGEGRGKYNIISTRFINNNVIRGVGTNYALRAES